jgi:hypothetical protein
MAVVVVVLVAILLLRDSGRSPEERLAAAPAAVDEQGTARLDMVVETGTIEITGTGGVDFESGAGWFDVDLLGETLEMRSDAETLYVRRAGEAQWVAVHADEVTGALDSFGSGPTEAIAFVDLLRGDLSEVEDLGEEEIDGIATTHLTAVIDAEAAPEDLAALAGDDGELPLDVWLDEDDLPVRQRLGGEVQGIELVVTLDLSGWGEPLGVAIPPEGEIRDVEPEELAQLFGRPAP